LRYNEVVDLKVNIVTVRGFGVLNKCSGFGSWDGISRTVRTGGLLLGKL
jgi:hypothetical protein